MKRVDQEEGQRLIKYGVSAEKFDPKALPLIQEFNALSTIKGCKLIGAVGNYIQTPDEAFDVVLTLYRENVTGFEILSVNPELIDCAKIKILYTIHLKKSIWGSEFDTIPQFVRPLYNEAEITGGTDEYNELSDSSH
jgi:hypothetical protein